MRNRFNLLRALIGCAAVLALAGSGAWADTTNFWTNTAGGNYTNTANWSAGAVPTTTDRPFWTNRQPVAYTVNFTSSLTNGPAFIYDDKVTYDLAGQRWQSNGAGIIGSNSTFATTVQFISTQASHVGATGNQVQFGNAAFGTQLSVAGTNTTILVNDSGGQPVRFVYYGSLSSGIAPGNKVVVSGPGTAFEWAFPNVGSGMNADMWVTNGALFTVTGGGGLGIGTSGVVTTRVINASMQTVAGGCIGCQIGNGTVILSNNSTWTDSGILQLGTDGLAAGPFRGTLVSDSSIYNGQKVLIGSDDGNGIAPGLLILNNGSTMTLSNGLVNSHVYPSGSSSTVTNTFVLNNSTLFVGGGAVSGYVTNYGLIRANGTITGHGAGNFLFWGGLSNGPTIGASHVVTNAAVLELGTGPGTLGKLVLNKGNFQMDPNTKTFFDFSNTGLDQIVATNGFARLLGSNVFALATGAPAPVHGVKYGLGVYDFVIATNGNISSPQSDNLVNLLTNTYHLTYGVDFQYGVVSIGGGLFALELTFVPEPSTFLLLALGGLMVWRRIAKRRAK